MSRSLMLSAAALALVTSLVASPTYARSSPVELKATLLGANEVPVQGDLEGSGEAEVFLHEQGARPKICFKIKVEDIALPATAAHIHTGTAGNPGPILIGLKAPNKRGKANGCVKNVGAEPIAAIKANPAGFYVNVHNAEFPGGALRGQLENVPN